MDFILNIIKSLFGEKYAFPKRGTGVYQNEEDYRDIELAAIQKPVGAPKSFSGAESILKILEILDQMQQPACVAHAIAQILMVYIYRKTGKVVKLSPRFAYKIMKMLDGIPNLPGTYPRIGALVFVKFGCAIEDLLKNDTSLSQEEYLAFELTKELLDNASENKMPGFASVNQDIESIKEAIYQNGAVAGSAQCGDWNVLPVKSTPNRGAHYTVWYRYEELANGDYKIYFKNTWGKGWLNWIKSWLMPGFGYFLWSEYRYLVRDIIAFTDIPADYLNKVKKLPFRFTKELSLGVTDAQVKELQKMLNESPETIVSLEGVGSAGQETIYFGPATKSALIKWQVKNGISSTGYFGQLSIKKANERIGKVNRIEDWAMAIQQFEGFYPGSRSYKNNNPGNIRYFSGLFASLAIGKDDKGFCIFETYAKGFSALVTLLTRAATGLSTVYSPENTILDFYEIYAPSSDDNHPAGYANFVASKLGVPVTTKIKDLL